MITQIIWVLSLPVMIIVSYQLIAITYKYLEKKKQQ